jgi:hypothetical protein
VDEIRPDEARATGDQEPHRPTLSMSLIGRDLRSHFGEGHAQRVS